MNILDKRPLALILSLSIGSFVLFAFIESLILKAVFASIFIFAFIISFIKHIKKHISKVVLLRLSLFFILISMLFSFLYFSYMFKPYNRFDEESTIYATVTEIENDNIIIIKTDRINDKTYPEFKMYFYIEDSFTNYSIGSEVKIKGKISPIKQNNYSFDTKSYYYSVGISAIVTEISEFEVVRVNDFTLEYKVSSIRKSIARRLVLTTERDSGGLLAALLLGEKEYLSKETALDFQRLGITHILALSGMHLVMLTFALKELLSLVRIKKKPAYFITVIFVLLYMLLTGMPVSIVRAGIMLIISSFLFILSQTHDGVTSLCIAVFIIICIEPYAIFDIALWLSAFATLGILVINELRSKKYRKKSILNSLISSLLATLFAISATFSLTVFNFPSASLLSAPATLIFSLLAQIYIYTGLVHLLLCSILPTGKIVCALGNFISSFASALSNIKNIQISVNFTSVRILAIIFSIIFFAFVLFEIKHKKTAVTVLSLLLVSVFAFSFTLTYLRRNDNSVIYNKGSNEEILITDSGKTMLIEIGNPKIKSIYNITELLTEENITYLDVLLFANYSEDLKDSLETVIGKVKIKEIYLPIPKSALEDEILSKAENVIDKSKIRLCLYENKDIIMLNNTEIFTFCSEIYDKNNNVILSIKQNGSIVTYLSPNAIVSNTKAAALDFIDKSNVIIIGARGYVRNFVFTYKSKECEKLIIADKDISLHKDTLDYYNEKEVYFGTEKCILIH